MNEDHSELIEYLDGKFNKVDKEFDKVDEKFKSLIDIFPTKEEVATKQDFEELRKDLARLADGVDAYVKKADTYFQEMVMLSHKVDRHEKWLLQIAEKLELKLTY